MVEKEQQHDEVVKLKLLHSTDKKNYDALFSGLSKMKYFFLLFLDRICGNTEAAVYSRPSNDLSWCKFLLC